ncbi:RpiB/LacA/LacB family sugar-phosphate isomerase [Candidatus Gracilibacteria bacterium]|nr:RpiB/LacA/LacB family sugar-phosphate isomerase [Candidatus Gracilibacteria bacterium]
MMKVFLGSDHGGFELKRRVLEHLKSQGYETEDLGCVDTSSCDYPVYGRKVAEQVVKNPGTRGIVVCGSGVGISIAANKIKGSRCVLANSVELARLGRSHNGANVLAMGERTKFIDAPIKIVDEFLKVEEDKDERHQRRRNLLNELGS